MVSKYIWRGYDLFDDHGAFQPSVNADLFGTGLEVGPLTVTPALYYQISLDDSVNDEDELWGGLSVSYRF